MTLGHLDIMKRASKLCDKLIVGVAINRAKNPLFGLDDRVQMVEHVVEPFKDRIEVEVLPFEGLLIHFVESCGASMIVFLMSDPQYQTIASRLVKEIARLGGDVSQFVTPEVDARLKDKFS